MSTPKAMGEVSGTGFVVTIGNGRYNSIGMRVTLDSDAPVRSLVSVLDEITPDTTEVWWAPSVFEGNHRLDEKWQSACAVGVDVDWFDRTASVPADALDRISNATSDDPVASFWHPTPGGVRFVYVFDRPIEDKVQWERVAKGAHEVVRTKLHDAALLGEGGFKMDDHGESIGMFWCPRTTDEKGRRRDAPMHVLRDVPFPLESLAAHAPNGVERKAPTAAAGEPITAGGRNNALTSLAGTMRKRDMTPEAILAALREENAHRCDPPLPESEVEKIARSVSRYEPDAKPATPSIEVINDPDRFLRASFSLADFLKREYPEPESLIGKGLLCQGSLGILYGVPGGGKSWAMLAEAIALGRGTPWFGLPTKQCRVGILEMELHAFTIQERLRVLLGDEGLEELSDRIHVVSRPDLDGRVSLMDAGDVQSLIHWCSDRRLDVLFIDALNRVHTVDENRANEMGQVLAALDDIRHTTGAAIKALHHEPKEQDGRTIPDLSALRGSTRLRDDPNMLCRLVKKDGGLRVLRFPKVNLGREPEPIWLMQTEAGPLEVTEAPPEKSNRKRERIKELVAEAASRGGITSDELQKQTGLKKTAVAGHLKALRVESVGAKGEPPRYLPASSMPTQLGVA